jgi:hypothetical protein
MGKDIESLKIDEEIYRSLIKLKGEVDVKTIIAGRNVAY